MLCIGEGIFFQLPGESKHRVLHSAKIIGVEKRFFTAEVAKKEDFAPEKEEQSIFIYFELKKAFLKQPARIDSITESETTSNIVFETIGEPVSAENRNSYRVSTVMADLTVEVGSEANCPLLDVSAVGFSIISGAHYNIGDIVDAAFEYDDKRYEGKGCVHGIRKLDDEHIRYGVQCTDDKRIPGNLRTGLQRISMAVQRQQLRRLAATS